MIYLYEILKKRVCLTVWQGALLVIILIGLYIYWDRPSTSSGSSISPPLIEKTQEKKDKKGTEYQEITQTLYTQEQMNKLTDSFKRVLKASKVKEVTTIVTTIHDTVNTWKTMTIDSTARTLEDSYKDSDIEVYYYADLLNKAGQFKIYLTPDSMSEIETVKDRWFKPNLHQVDFYHTNKLFNTLAGNSYTYQEPNPRLNVVLFGGYDAIHNRPAFGIGLGWSILKLK